MTNRGFIQILGPVLVVIALVGGGYIYYQLHYAKPVTQAPVIDSGSSNENTFGTNYGAKPTPPQINPTQPVACTAEAKICPDGSAVGRTGPKCEFAACPAIKPEWKNYNWNNVIYYYPTNWTVEQTFYLSPGAQDRGETPINNGLMFKPLNQSSNKDTILVGGHMISTCQDVPAATKCEWGGKKSSPTVTYTFSENSEILSIFEQLVSKAKVN